MKRYVILTMLVTTSAAVQLQTLPPASAQAPPAVASSANGTPLFTELSAAVDSKKANAGDPVSARLTEAIKSEGKIVIPKGARILGRVTQSSSKAKGDSDSVLGIQFDKVLLKDGQELPLTLSIVAIAAEQRPALQSSPDQNVLAGTGSAAEAGSPMKQTPQAVQGVNGPAGPASNPGGIQNAWDPNSTPSGLNPTGQLTAKSRGVFGFDGVRLSQSVKQGSLISTPGKNLHFDSGTKLLLLVQSEPTAAAPPSN